MPKIDTTCNLSDDEAHALMKMLKRLGHTDFARLAETPEQAHQMKLATFKVLASLAYAGFEK